MCDNNCSPLKKASAKSSALWDCSPPKGGLGEIMALGTATVAAPVGGGAILESVMLVMMLAGVANRRLPEEEDDDDDDDGSCWALAGAADVVVVAKG